MDYAGAKYYKMSQTAASILKYRCKNYGFRADCRNRCQGMLFANIQTVVLTGFRAHSDQLSLVLAVLQLLQIVSRLSLYLYRSVEFHT